MSEQSQHPTVLDGDDQQVGALYGKALLNSAGDAVDSVVAELEQVVTECLDKHPGLESVLSSPRVSHEEKEGMLDRIFGGKIDGKLLNFLKILCRRGRVGSLRAIQVSASEIRQEQLGQMRVLVTSALPLNDSQRSQIASALKAAHGKDPILLEKVDESLLGGIMIRIGDQVIDGSALGRMESIRSAVASGVQKSIRDRYESLLSS